MHGMGTTIPAGIGIIVLLYLVLYRFTPLNTKHSAFIVSLLSLVVYFPVAILFWPGVDVMVLNVTAYLMTSYILGILFTYREARKRGDANGKWFHWAPAIIVGFFVLILVVDAIFVTISVEGIPESVKKSLTHKGEDQSVRTVFPGLVHNNYYKKESKFNEYLRQVEAIRKKGWHIHKGWLGKTPKAGKEGIFQVVLEDKEGKRIDGVELHGRFMRPSDSRKDVRFQMKEISTGQFQVRIVLPEPGAWDLSLQLHKDDVRYNLRASTTIDEN
jgi:nitrogen fixation protein FixH